MSFDFAIPMLWLAVGLMVVMFETQKLLGWFGGGGSRSLSWARA